MKAIYLLLTLIGSTFALSALTPVQETNDEWHYDIVKCTQTFQSVVDSLFGLTIEIETNLFNPDSSKFSAVLQPLQDMLSVCTNVNIDAVKYSDCVVRVEGVLPTVGKLVDAIKSKDTKDIIFEASEVGLTLLNGISYCIDL